MTREWHCPNTRKFRRLAVIREMINFYPDMQQLNNGAPVYLRAFISDLHPNIYAYILIQPFVLLYLKNINLASHTDDTPTSCIVMTECLTGNELGDFSRL